MSIFERVKNVVDAIREAEPKDYPYVYFLDQECTLETFPKREFRSPDNALLYLEKLAELKVTEEEFADYYNSVESVQKSIENLGKLGDTHKKALSALTSEVTAFMARVGNAGYFTPLEVSQVWGWFLSYSERVATHQNAIVRYAKIKALMVEYKKNML